MFDSVSSVFQKFNEPIEGSVSHMYLDVKGLVTIGVGNLIDPVGIAMFLPFIRKDTGFHATRVEIQAEFQRVKNRADLASHGAKAFASITTLILTSESINALINQRLIENEKIIKTMPWFAGFEMWPADAQLGLLSMVWALGPTKLLTFHHFCADCIKGAFGAAAVDCRINESGNPGVAPRNSANKILFLNAEAVQIKRLDPSILHYPASLDFFPSSNTMSGLIT